MKRDLSTKAIGVAYKKLKEKEKQLKEKESTDIDAVYKRLVQLPKQGKQSNFNC